MKKFKANTTGDRINLFENSSTNDVKTFNMIFKDFKLNLPENDLIEIGEIIRSNCYEIITTSGEKLEQFFERRKLDESIIDDFRDFTNDDY